MFVKCPAMKPEDKLMRRRRRRRRRKMAVKEEAMSLIEAEGKKKG